MQYECGGLIFTLSVLWAQVFPFVALQFYDGGEKDTITKYLIGSFALWLTLNIIFLNMIDSSYSKTIFDTSTAPQYTCELFLKSEEDSEKFQVVFSRRISYTKSIHELVKVWIAINIERWREEQPEWLKIEKIPDHLLPIEEVYEAEGGAERSRNSVRFSDFSEKIAPALILEQVEQAPATQSTSAWLKLAEAVYLLRGSHKANSTHVNRIFEENSELVAPLLARCPVFKIILCHILEDEFDLRVKRVKWTSNMDGTMEGGGVSPSRQFVGNFSEETEDRRRGDCGLASTLRT